MKLKFITSLPSYGLKQSPLLLGHSGRGFSISNQFRPGNDRALENRSFLVTGQTFCVLFRAWCCPGKPDF